MSKDKDADMRGALHDVYGSERTPHPLEKLDNIDYRLGQIESELTTLGERFPREAITKAIESVKNAIQAVREAQRA